MEEFKGTKGNWNACCTDDDSKSHYVFGAEGNGGTICAMLSNDPDDDDASENYEPMEDVVTRSERQANAKLIECAP